jgi:hypothetical protein
MFQSFQMELITRANGNGHQNMPIVIFEKE